MSELPGSDVEPRPCPIPRIESPIGRHWSQPDPNEFLFHETHVRMLKKTWLRLPEYNHSRPSGVYEGKMWRSQKHLHWYGPHPDDKDAVQIHHMPVLICENVRREDGRICLVERSGKHRATYWLAPKCDVISSLPREEMTDAPVTCVLCLGR